jgi:hypothetical protein
MANDPKIGSQRTTHTKKETTGQHQDPPQIISAELQIPPSIINEYHSQQKDNNRQDRKRFHIECITLIVIMIYTGIAGYQGCKMREVTEASKESALAAKQSAEIARNALTAGQRAFISVSIDAIPVVDIKTDKIAKWTFIPVWKNTGETPTRNMKNHINIAIFEGPLDSKWDFPDCWSANIAPESRLPTPLGAAPKSNTYGHPVSVSIDDMMNVIARPKPQWLYMWGWAIYNDVFPNTPVHVTRFAVQIVVHGNPNDKAKISFTYEFLLKYNCSDEECEHQGYPASWAPREFIIE